MQLNLENKLALVTGSTMGIGKAVAVGLLKEGAQVIVNGRSPERVAATVEELSSIGTAYGIAADLATVEATEKLIALANEIGNVDILVNNAGKFMPKVFVDSTDEDWFDHYNVNVMSGVRVTRALMPAMLQRNWGRVIFVSSEAALKPMPELIHYAVTKTAQISLARGLAELTKGTQVTVNSVLVAPTRTDGSEAFFKANGMNDYAAIEAEFFRTHGITSLLQRFATPQEIADVIIFLCSPNAAAINGAAQRVEGGIVRSIL
jgi:NAD(P)-dependent dehydrogenase (short-subunit alcohol dehydrogenase family)